MAGNLINVSALAFGAYVFIYLLLLLFFQMRGRGAQAFQPQQPGASLFKNAPPGIVLSSRWKLLLGLSALVLFTRVIIFFLAYGGLIFFKHKAPGFCASLETLWRHWDAEHYLTIAQYGYKPLFPYATPLIVFMPVYPLLVRVFHLFIPSYLMAALAVSHAGLIAACYFLYQLVLLDYEEGVARRAVKYLLIFPFSFFLSAVFTEGVFLAFFVASVYLIRREKWFLAGCVAVLAVLTRLFPGNCLLIIAFIEMVLFRAQRGKAAQETGAARGFLIFTAFIFAANIFYLGLNKVLFNNWFQFLSHQKEFWHHDRYLLFASHLKEMFITSLKYQPHENIALWYPQIVLFFMIVFLLALTLRKMRLSYSFYTFIYIVVFVYGAFWLISGARYVTAVFPLFLMLGLISENKWVDFMLTFACIMGLAYYVLLFTHGSYVI